ncbi:MAG TPA: transglycosylase domain-containing protein, partial [Vicinamibacterales bacterium]|nr:transglycosylase domain-containing protein [Vicinamibacterales bacterium]
MKKTRTKTARVRIRVAAIWRKRWVRITAAVLAVPTVILCFVATYYAVSFGRLIDARLHGERDTTLPRVFARPLELRRGQSLTDRQLIDRLNDLGYALRERVQRPGEFAVGTGAVAIMPRSPDFKGQIVRVVFERPPAAGRAPARRAPPRPADRVLQLELGSKPSERLVLDAPVLTSLGGGEREKRRPVALSVIPQRVREAVLAIEDRRFYEHPGIDPIGILGAVISNIRGKRGYTAGGSTITQQVARNVFLPKMFPEMSLQAAREKSFRRKLLEIWVSLILTTRASKDEILEMYLNDMTLGQRGSFGIVGVAEASRLFFGKDVSNVTLAEAATIAGVFQSPSALSPFNNPARCKDRRNVVLGAMVDGGYIAADVAARAQREPLTIVQRALEAEAPYFVDFVAQTLSEQYPGLTTTTDQGVDVYTTLDLHLQRVAQDAVRDGLTGVDNQLARRKRGKTEAALIAVDPRTGEILAFVGGRSYNQSQYNRTVVSRRQPGSVFKPFV